MPSGRRGRGPPSGDWTPGGRPGPRGCRRSGGGLPEGQRRPPYSTLESRCRGQWSGCSRPPEDRRLSGGRSGGGSRWCSSARGRGARSRGGCRHTEEVAPEPEAGRRRVAVGVSPAMMAFASSRAVREPRPRSAIRRLDPRRPAMSSRL